jgi:hypothetical protein
MKDSMTTSPNSCECQLGFDALLASAQEANTTRQQERACAHLPGTMDMAVPFYRDLIERHHRAMLAGELETVMQLRDEAHLLAVKLNGYDHGILADEDAPGYALDRATRAPDGAVPLWGQSGSFEIISEGMRVRIEMEGMLGIGASFMAWMDFAAHAADFDKPFLSETGYRSFLGGGGDLQPGFTPDSYACAIIAAHVRRELKGKLVAIKPEYRLELQT